MVQRRGKLRPAEAALDVGGLRVLEVAYPAGIGEAALGQHVPGIGLGIGREFVDVAVEPDEPALQRGGRHRHRLVAGTQQEVEGIALQPFGGRREGTPHAERAVGELHVDDAVDRVLDAVRDGGIRGAVTQQRHVVVVEQRQGAAGGLFDAAIGVFVERA
jgi:hypothetical protein